MGKGQSRRRLPPSNRVRRPICCGVAFASLQLCDADSNGFIVPRQWAIRTPFMASRKTICRNCRADSRATGKCPTDMVLNSYRNICPQIQHQVHRRQGNIVLLTSQSIIVNDAFLCHRRQCETETQQ